MNKVKSIFQSIGAVLAGYFVSALLTSLTIAILGILFPESYTAENLAYAISTSPPSSEYANQPVWYYPVLAITVLPSILLGAWLFVRGANKLSPMRQNM